MLASDAGERMARTNADYLRWKLGRWARGHAPNILMFEGNPPTDIRLEPNETAIAQISLASGESPIVVTDIRLIRDGQSLLRYDELRYCIWIDRDLKMKGKLKQTHFQRIILERHDTSELVLDGLGQAVFPLLKFFRFKLGRGEPAA